MNLFQRPILWLFAALVSIAILVAGDPSLAQSDSSGKLVYGGGDSRDLQRRQLIDELQKRRKESI